MYLIDTNVISELRKGRRTHSGVRQFFKQLQERSSPVYLSVVTLGELRRGVDLIRHRGDAFQAQQLEDWLCRISQEYADFLLPFDREVAQVWGRLRVPNPHNALDKQIAATALVYDLTVVTRNVRDFQSTGVKLLNPF